jgi:hypothetical protein
MNVVLSVYLTQRADPQRKKIWPGNDDRVVKTWIESLTAHGLTGIIFHDGLNQEFTAKWTRSNVTFLPIVWSTPWTAAEERAAIYLTWLQEHDDCEFVLTTDLSDVEFFADPFKLMTRHDTLYIGSEPWKIGGTIVAKWMQQAYGIVSHAEQPILNPGIVGGKRELLRKFMFNWLLEMWKACQPTPPPHDLAAFNRLIYREGIRFVTGHPLHTVFRKSEPSNCGAAIRHK